MLADQPSPAPPRASPCCPDLSGACSTESDDVPRNMAENALALPHLTPHLVAVQDLITILPDVFQSVPCTAWQQVS